MTKDVSPQMLGTDQVRWSLDRLYKTYNDPQILADAQSLVADMQAFEARFKGKLDTHLGESLEALDSLYRLWGKVNAYFDLFLARDASHQDAQKASSRVVEFLTRASAKHMTFFDLEVGRMDWAAVEAQITHPAVAQHVPWIRQTQVLARYSLSEEVEASLSRFAPFGTAAWSEMMAEWEGELCFEFEGRELNLPEILHITSEDRDPARRARAMETVNTGLARQKHTDLAARTLNVTAGTHLANDDMRGYSHPMQRTNLENKVDDATVDMLHSVVEELGAPLARRFYTLKKRLLGLETLAWSDRNAPMPFADDRVIEWQEACRIVQEAYRAFSPTLGDLVDCVLDPKQGWVDAPPVKNKIGGAFDYTVLIPGEERSYMLLNYMGSSADVMTLAHELGHAVHGLLAGPVQGVLQWNAPMPYAETASIFGEMLTFDALLKRTRDPKQKLALYMNKLSDFMNTVVRQICFSQFEQGIYAARKSGKLTREDFKQLWMNTTTRFYGEDGDVFRYNNIDNMWSYVSHFYAYKPFYVYAYAFGELFTQSLMAQRERLDDHFEPLYLDLLKAGGTKDAVALMEPFGLNPNGRTFWEQGIKVSAETWLAEANMLADELGL